MLSLPRLSFSLLIVFVCLLIPACGKSKITAANFDKIKEGMTFDEVEAILGKGTKDDSGSGAGVGYQIGIAVETPGSGSKSKVIETWVWESGKKSITVTFNQGKMINKKKDGF